MDWDLWLTVMDVKFILIFFVAFWLRYLEIPMHKSMVPKNDQK